jgi:hypothetical protein
MSCQACSLCAAFQGIFVPTRPRVPRQDGPGLDPRGWRPEQLADTRDLSLRVSNLTGVHGLLRLEPLRSRVHSREGSTGSFDTATLPAVLPATLRALLSARWQVGVGSGSAAMRFGYKTFMRPKRQCKPGIPMLMANDGTPFLIFAMAWSMANFLFIAHGVMELTPLGKHIQSQHAVYAIQARELDGERAPCETDR